MIANTIHVAGGTVLEVEGAIYVGGGTVLAEKAVHVAGRTVRELKELFIMEEVDSFIVREVDGALY